MLIIIYKMTSFALTQESGSRLYIINKSVRNKYVGACPYRKMISDTVV